MSKKVRKPLTPERREQLRKQAHLGGLAKRGKRSAHVIERELILASLKDKIAGRALKLMDAQTMLAMGAIKIFRIDYEYVGKNKTKIAKKPKLITNEDEIIRVLDWEYGSANERESDEEGEETDGNPNTDTEFYFVMTKDPDNKAIDSLLDRTFGKSTENKKITFGDIDVDEETESLATEAVKSFIRAKQKA